MKPAAEPFTVSVPGAALAAERRCGDGPAIVLLHAGVADRRAWRAAGEALAARGADVVAHDRRGFGETTADDAAFSHVEDLVAVLDAVGRDPVWLVGSSQGGLIALDAALTVPDRLAGLVLISPAVSGAPEPPDEELDPGTQRLAAQLDEADEAGDLDRVNEVEAELWLDGPAGPAQRVGGAARELLLDMNGIALRSDLPEDAGGAGLEAWSRLDEVRLPVTLTWGDLDLPFIVERCEELAARLPDLRATHVFAGTAHLPYLERPDEVAGVIAAAVGLPAAA